MPLPIALCCFLLSRARCRHRVRPGLPPLPMLSSLRRLFWLGLPPVFRASRSETSRFGGFLASIFRTFFALLVQTLLAAEQFEEGFVRAVALVPAGADNASVSAVAIAEARSDRIEQLYDGFVGHQVGGGQTACG